MPQDDRSLSEALGPRGANVILSEHLQHHRAGHPHRARCQIGAEDQTRHDEDAKVADEVVAQAHQAQRGSPPPPDRREDEDNGGQPEVGRRQAEDGEGATGVVSQGVLLDCRVNPDGHSDQQTDEDRHQTQFDGGRQPAGDQLTDRFRLQQRFAQIATQEYAAHPAAILHGDRHVQPQPPLELRTVDVGAAACPILHPVQKRVYDIPWDEPHREEHQNGDQKKGRNQQQDPPDDVRFHSFYRKVSVGNAPECSSVIAIITNWVPTTSIELTESRSEPNLLLHSLSIQRRA